MRVHVNGLQPLITSATIDFFNGDEAIANLVYEMLEMHCTNCLKLDHEKTNCPELRQFKQARKRGSILGTPKTCSKGEGN